MEYFAQIIIQTPSTRPSALSLWEMIPQPKLKFPRIAYSYQVFLRMAVCERTSGRLFLQKALLKNLCTFENAETAIKKMTHDKGTIKRFDKPV